MTRRGIGVGLLAGGGVVTMVGLITAVVFFLQPWRTCPYDDVPAGCAMLPADAAVMEGALVVMFVGVCILIAGGIVLNGPRGR
ncbi:hypothetical protein [Marisediminicola sp. LYQ134]|uniref:hypothetical protein n=1 Tax=Marisediminicola sp. LYQ134 TaxID=3391061 RepID=UPI0039830918